MRIDKFAATALAALCVLLAFFAPAGPAAAQQPSESAVRIESVLRIPADDPKMATAMKRARATLDDFLALQQKPKPNMTGFTVKVPLWTGSQDELVWLSPFKVEPNGDVRGVLLKPTVDTGKYKTGDTLVFPKSAIADWGYFEGERMMGNFTTCVLVDRDTKVDAKALKESFHLHCDD